jgi:peptidoglycan-associated lipoprotein
MKLNKSIGLPVFALIIAFSAAGCKTKPPGVTNLDNGKSKPTAIADIPPASAVKTTDDVTGKEFKDGSLATNDRNSHTGWKEDADAFKGDTVHFDYDSSVIKDTEKTKLQAIATQLKASTSAAVRIEGHCDERGTEEYNRSLGERRALALREELAKMGVEPNRLDTISFGDGKPVVIGHDESSYRQNRRGEFVQLTPPQ